MSDAHLQFPAQLEIAVRNAPVAATVRPPGSKSLTNRALVAAALGSGVSRLLDPLEAEDTEAMREGLRAMGVSIDDVDDPWLILGSGGDLTQPGAPIDAREAGTVARFLAAVAALVPGGVTIDGQGRMRTRPMTELLTALERIGAIVDHQQGKLPLTVTGGSLSGGRVEVDPSRSSQFVSALLLIAPLLEGKTEIVMTAEPVSRPYLNSTVEVMTAFGAGVEDRDDRFLVAGIGYRSAHYPIEADASAAAYPLVAAAITAGRVVIDGIPAGSTQPDLALVKILEVMGCTIMRTDRLLELQGPSGPLRAVEVDMRDSPDAALALAVACLFADGESRIGGLGSLRHKESDRLTALEGELRRVGGSARLDGDALVVGPGPLQAALVRTHNDHRMAMSLALVGLRQPGIVIDAPGCVAKTWPRYFSMLSGL
ncbi:MAG TPA: 3-phosphoshikimate 1-carboxyvinyltransferase [Acidimicrobiia bacterium]|nr:3-phosphoshikimate 1-carboxyvinyltransferase [Acidimicrobiia bacterium]